MTLTSVTNYYPAVQCFLAYAGLALYHIVGDPIISALYGWLAVVAFFACRYPANDRNL